MSQTNTTLSSAMLQTDVSIVVASATGFAANQIVRVDGEWMKVAQNYSSGTTIPVIRGQDGSIQVAHAKNARVATSATLTDFIAPPGGTDEANTTPTQPGFPLKSYGVAGAIDVRQHVAIITGTSALAMTLADPTPDMDGQMLFIISNGKANHTVTYTTGLGAIGANADVATFPSGAQSCAFLMAANAVWCAVATGGTALIFPVWA